MKKAKENSILTYQEAYDILLPENKLYIGEVDSVCYWIKQNSISYIALGLTGGKPFPVRGFITRITTGTIIKHDGHSYLVTQDEDLHIVLKRQPVRIKKAVL